MASKSDLRKRRVRAEKQEAARSRTTPTGPRRNNRTRTLGVVFLAVMLVLPLTAGLIAATSGRGSESPTPPVESGALDTDPPGLVDPGFEGAALAGPTPCPAIDGSQERVTAFAQAPPRCLADNERIEIVLDTLGGPVDLTVDVALDPVAADLFVTLARYGVYDGAPITSFPGLVTIGGGGDAGFRLTGATAPRDGTYPVGSIVMLSDFDGALEGQVVIVTDAAGSAALATDAIDPIIGTVTDGLDAFTALRDLQQNNPSLTYRIQSTAVSVVD